MTQSNRPLNWVKENWSILAFLVFIIVTWANMTTASTSQAKRLDVVESTIGKKVSISDFEILEQRVDEDVKANNEIKVRLSSIETNLLWIKEKLSKY